jgi:uncharacterized protein (DUF885 family)
LLLALLCTLGLWTYSLLWGRPWSLNQFYLRTMLDTLRPNPQLFTQLGFIDGTLLDFHSGKLTDASPRYTEAMDVIARNDLDMLRTYPRKSQSPDQQLSTAVLEWFLEDAVRLGAFRYHDYPVSQLDGPHIDLPDFMVTVHKLENQKTARRYVERLRATGWKFDGLMESLRIREQKGVLPPRFVLEKALEQMRSFTNSTPETNPLYTGLERKLTNSAAISASTRPGLLGQARDAIQQQVYPAYARLIACVESILPKGTTEDGVWKLPDGAGYYAAQLRHFTTTDYTPDQVHEMGLREVERLTSEMRAILDAKGYRGKTVGEQVQAIMEDPRFLYPDTDEGRSQMIRDYQSLITEVSHGLQGVFDLRPKSPVVVERVPAFKEKGSAAAYYNAPAMDGSRPGIFFVSAWDVKLHPKPGMRTLTYHEAVPGHHFQIAIAQELKGVPLFRRFIPFTAYIEGWAMYSERLADELGFVKDPFDRLGTLQSELFRAARLVVDTGIHAKRWNRQQAIDYMKRTTGMTQSDVEAEVERYIVWPGQACSYKVGMLKILELREKAKAELGPKFSLPQFHNVVLKNGALPLTLLEQLVNEWVQGAKSR